MTTTVAEVVPMKRVLEVLRASEFHAAVSAFARLRDQGFGDGQGRAGCILRIARGGGPL
jgi:hypothetical protein